jgi:virulence-associated protein VagC
VEAAEAATEAAEGRKEEGVRRKQKKQQKKEKEGGSRRSSRRRRRKEEGGSRRRRRKEEGGSRRRKEEGGSRRRKEEGGSRRRRRKEEAEEGEGRAGTSMEKPRMLLLPLLLLPLLLLLPASSAISTPCISIFQILSPCSSALTSSSSGGDADQPSPSPSCCLPLQSVLSNGTQFGCLCSMLGNSQYQAMLQAALRLPELCHLPIVATEDNCTTLASTGLSLLSLLSLSFSLSLRVLHRCFRAFLFFCSNLANAHTLPGQISLPEAPIDVNLPRENAVRMIEPMKHHRMDRWIDGNTP